MDWIVDPSDARALAAFGADVRRHLGSVAAVATGVEEATARVVGAVAEAPPGNPTWVHLGWPKGSATVRLQALGQAGPRPQGPAGVVPVQRLGSLPSPDGSAAELDLGLERARPKAFESGPPPAPPVDVDAHRDGVAAVAAGLVAVRESHPASDPEQASALAGAALAEQAAPDHRTPATLVDAVDAFVAAHRALGSDAEVARTTEDGTVEVAVSRCPLGPGVVGHPAACPVTTSLAGRLAAMVGGEASVVLDRAIARGDDQCHVRVATGSSTDPAAESFLWPPVTSNAETAPHLQLSVLLPSESSSVPVVRRLAAQALRTFGVEDDQVHDVRLAITEACANVIDHAEDTDTYEVRVELAADRCALTIVDQGRGFDSAAVPRNVALTAEDGRGLALMRALVDRVAFRSEPQAGAVVHMVKALRYDEDHPLRHR